MNEHNREKIILRDLYDFGEIIEIYFKFLKQNLKSLLNLFFRYNGILLIFVFIGSYIFVSGAMDLIMEAANGTDAPSNQSMFTFFGGIAIFVLLLMFLTMYNYGLACSYISNYEEKGVNQFTHKDVFKRLLNRLPTMILVILLAIVLYVVMAIISIIFAFIPFIGTIAYYVIALGYSAWLGLTFMDVFYTQNGVLESYSEAWSLLTKNFWKSVGVNIVVGIMLSLILILTSFVPGIIGGIYIYHSVESGVELQESLFFQVISVFGVFFFVVLAAFWQVLSQLVNGVLYFNLHEKSNLSYTQTRIEEIGVK